MDKSWKSYLQLAVDEFGSQAKLATAMAQVGAEDCSQSKISWLLKVADKISAEDALAVHRATKGVVTAHQLRPDLWPTPGHMPIKAEPARGIA